MTRASAPGKIILFGEHAVVYGRPALAVPVTQVHADVEVTAAPRRGIWIHAPDVNLHAELASLSADHPLGAAIRSVFGPHPRPLSRFRERGGGEGIEINISSTIPVASGLGSGAAVTVALLRALSSFLLRSLSFDEVNSLAYEIEKLHHGTPSGIDNTVITYARPVYFIKGQPIETFTVGAPFTIVIGDTGIRAPTKESVGDVRKLWEADQARWEKVFDEVGEIAKSAREKIERGKKKEELGALMNANHALLQEMTVSSLELDRLIVAARVAGALGAKLSGGGRGGNMIALVEKESAPAVAEALMSAGAKRTIITEVI